MLNKGLRCEKNNMRGVVRFVLIVRLKINRTKSFLNYFVLFITYILYFYIVFARDKDCIVKVTESPYNFKSGHGHGAMVKIQVCIAKVPGSNPATDSNT